MVGIVTKVGSQVTKFKVGDKAGVGCLVDSCFDCVACQNNDEQYYNKGTHLTYNHGRLGKNVPGNPDC